MSNICISADAYTISSDAFASKECRHSSVYNFVNRVSPAKAFKDLAFDSRMVFYGIRHVIEFIENNRVTNKDIEQAEKFMSRAHSFGGGLAFNGDMWRTVVNKFNGYLPISIMSIPEGSTFFPNEPVVQVISLEPGFGELAAHIEGRLVGAVSIGSACATLCRHWLERMCDEVEKDFDILGRDTSRSNILQNAQWQIHNFGLRACANEDESILTGLAHLLSFNGTDNFDAAYRAWELGCDSLTGTSIHALAHRNVQGHNREIDAFRALADSTDGDKVRIASFVADCYNYSKAVEDLVTEAKSNPDMTYVIRPDSGDCYTTLRMIYDECVKQEVYRVENGMKVPLNVRFIYGDSVKPFNQFDVMNSLRTYGMLPTVWGIWGVGGYIRNTPNRDSLSSAYKLAAKGDNDEPVVKLSETTGKLSIPYVNYIMRPNDLRNGTVIPVHIDNEYNIRSLNTIVYHPNIIGTRSLPKFSDVKDRCINEFEKYRQFACENPSFGLNRETLHPIIKSKQDEFYKKFRTFS